VGFSDEEAFFGNDLEVKWEGGWDTLVTDPAEEKVSQGGTLSSRDDGGSRERGGNTSKIGVAGMC